MEPISAIFERLGGPAKVAAIIGKSTEHAAGMRRRRSIPIRYWPALVAATPLPGQAKVTHGELIAAHVRRAAAPASTTGAAA